MPAGWSFFPVPWQGPFVNPIVLNVGRYGRRNWSIFGTTQLQWLPPPGQIP